MNIRMEVTTKIPVRLIINAAKAHSEAVDAAMDWARAAAKGHKTERVFDRHVKAEDKFAATITAIMDAAK